MRAVEERTWDELRPGSSEPPVGTPSSGVLAQLFADSASAWWDDRATRRREDRDAILAASLAAA
jgi:hypothetical protein